MTPERWRQIEELFHAARERPEALAQADPELRREVEALLSQDAPAQMVLDRPAADLLPDSTCTMVVVGSQVGPYRIDGVIGAGGMGEVYRALDTKLNRPVAVKFLSQRLADPAARRRFQREAQMASSLNHPHILTVYDAGEWEGRQYLVTEYIDGGTLREWGKSGKRTWREIVELLLGVADGLAAAHEARIMHRDIKPANILITRSGYAKLADFGLAKLVEEPAPSDVTKTLTEHATKPGMVVGTVAYMSPEQAAGRTVDGRSDIFSFGIVLYELLAGRRPFEGKSDLEVLQTILHGAAPRLPEEVPPALRSIVEKALEREPGQRYQSMREMVADLRRLVREPAPAAGGMRMRPWRVVVAVAALVIACLAAWRPWRAGNPGGEPLRAVPLATLSGVRRYPSLSPDGNYVAFTWTGIKQDNPDIYVQQIGAGNPLRLTTDPANDYNPVWSPDGRWIAFLRSLPEPGHNELRLIPPLGGPEKKLAEIRIRGEIFVTPPYLAWCPASDCLVVTDSPSESQPAALFVVSLETGEKRPLTHPTPPATGDTNPAVSPDGRWLVFRRNLGAVRTGELHLLALGKGAAAAGEPRRLTPASLEAEDPAWMPESKEILFRSRGRELLRLRVAGDSSPSRLPFVGDDGMMPVVSRPQPGRPPRLVYVRSSRNYNLWLVETSAPGAPAAAPPAVSISSTRKDYHQQFSPDGRRVAFGSDRSGTDEIWLADPDGSNTVQVTSTGGAYPYWSRDGERIVFQSLLEGQWDIFLMPAAGGKPRNLTSHPASDVWPSFSHDGQWIYFTSNRSGEWQVWKMPSSGGDAIQLTRTVGMRPLESPDGAWLYYVQTRETPSALWRIPVSGGSPVKVLEGVVLFNFAVIDKGIYYIDRPSGQGGVYYNIDWSSGETRLQYFDFATRRSSTVARNLGNVFIGLTASPDGRRILYARIDSSVDDLMLVDNFH